MDLEKNIQDCRLVFLDLETTGLLLEKNAICEVAAYKVEKEKIIDQFYSLVHPQQKVPYPAFCIHQISDRDLIGAPHFKDVAPKLVNFLSESIFCAYNAGFDLGFINYQLKKSGFRALNVPIIDILALARNTLKLKSYKLEAVAKFFDLGLDLNLHRAKDDAYLAYLLFYKLITILKKKQPTKAENLIDLYGL